MGPALHCSACRNGSSAPCAAPIRFRVGNGFQDRVCSGYPLAPYGSFCQPHLLATLPRLALSGPPPLPIAGAGLLAMASLLHAGGHAGDRGRGGLRPPGRARRDRLFGPRGLSDRAPRGHPARATAGRRGPCRPTPWALADLLAIAAENSREYQTRRRALPRGPGPRPRALAPEHHRLRRGGRGPRRHRERREPARLLRRQRLGRAEGRRLLAASRHWSHRRRLDRRRPVPGRDHGDTTQVTSDLSLSITQPLLRGPVAASRWSRSPRRSATSSTRSGPRATAASSPCRWPGACTACSSRSRSWRTRRPTTGTWWPSANATQAVAAARPLPDRGQGQAQQNEVRSEGQLCLAARQPRAHEGQPDALPRAAREGRCWSSIGTEFSALEAIASEEQVLDEVVAIEAAFEQRLEYLTTLDELTDAGGRRTSRATRSGSGWTWTLASPSTTWTTAWYDWQSTSWTAGLSLDCPGTASAAQQLPQRAHHPRGAQARGGGGDRWDRRLGPRRHPGPRQRAHQLPAAGDRRRDRRAPGGEHPPEPRLRPGQHARCAGVRGGPPGGPQQPRLGPRQPHPRASRPPPELEALRVDGEGITFDQDLIASIEAQPTP